MHSHSNTISALPLVTLICSAMLLITVITSSGSLVSQHADGSESRFGAHVARVLGGDVAASSTERM